MLQKLEQTVYEHKYQTRIKPLSECHRQDILQDPDAEHIPEWAWLNRFSNSEVNKEFSRIVVKNDQIIDWLITFSLAYKTLDHRILWINGKHRETGIAIRALAVIIRKSHFQESGTTATSSNTNDLGIP